ncbi:MAG: caspase family protein [Rubricoccaceae bacterium]|nr:caspase family protein [Rubricoccaceae bacterium]
MKRPGFLLLPAHRVVPLAAALLLAQAACSQQGGHSGRLDASDPALSTGEYYDEYPVELAAGDWVELDLRATAFDPYLVLVAPSGHKEQNDDVEGDRTRSYLRVQASESGTWRAYVTSYASGETGDYQLRIHVGDQPACEDCPPAQTAGVGAAGPRYERGQLEGGDETLTSGEFVDAYVVEGRAGQPLVLDLRSTAFDPYLILQMPDGEQVDNDDHEGDRTRSLISTTLPETGPYRVLVTSYDVGETGAYDLTIRGGEGGGLAAGGGQSRAARGQLGAGDGRRRSGEYYDTYTFEGVPGRRVRLDLRSSAFDPYLVLQPPRGEALKNDDFEGDLTRSRIEYDVSEPGLYRVYVTSYAPDEQGAYELAMDFSERFGGVGTVAEGEPAPSAGGFDAGELAIDQAAAGSLAPSDRRLETGEFVDLHVFDGQAGEPVRIEMTSSAFDTYLVVTTPAGEIITNDDHEGDRTRSLVEMVMPMDGRYRIEATSYAPGETGAYRLRITQADAMRPEPPAYDRIAGLFVGISDYGGRATDLAYTAADAALIRDALVRGAGMRPDDAVVLTDRAATRDAFRAAVRDLAARTDERTLFVLFFSGHGARYPRAGAQAADPDGHDESIELYDGEILDDELNALLAPLRAGHQLVVLDACYSGGFAKDLISRPGRMGLFSSEEDVVSAVASKFEAGGYLSRFFSDALTTPEADEDRNRALTPLELSEYLRARYAGDVRNSGLEAIVAGETRPGHQHLVVDRGSLGAFSTLFLLR